MVALRIQDQRGNGTSRPRQEPLEQRFNRNITHQRRNLRNIAVCFIDQPAMLPLQCSESIERLDALRRTARAASIYLSHLEPDTTRQLRPHACITLLDMLYYQLTELIQYIAMFAPICQAISYERISLHLAICSLFPRVLATYDDVTDQLAALNDPERSSQGSQNQEGRAAL